MEYLIVLCSRNRRSELQRQKTLRLHNIIRDVTDPFKDPHFQLVYRLTPELAKSVIDELRPYYPQTAYGNAIPVEIKQKQLGDMEGEVQSIQMELEEIRRQRRNSLPKTKEVSEEIITEIKHFHDNILRMPETNSYTREETELSKLREELMRAKTLAEEERFQRIKYEGKFNDLELKLNGICCDNKTSESKESRKITEEEVIALKTQVRDLKEQTEEMNMTIEEKSEQLQEYRVKYLQAQQQVEELKGRLKELEYENKQASDQIQIELQKMKMQFQEKLLELAPLPDLLKGSQMQLEEAKQLQKLAEDSAQQISNELHRVKEKLVVAVNSLNQEKIEYHKLMQECVSQRQEFDEKQKEFDELSRLNDDYKCTTVRLEEKLTQLQMRYDEKAQELIQLTKDFDELKEESSRSLNRAKERSDSTRHFLQTQIADLERQMISCRAQCKTYQKERDDLRQRMQLQVHSLKENFEIVDVRLRGLQNQVCLLKQCYSVTLPEEVEDNIDQENFNN